MKRFFTLIELIVVIVVLGILAAIVVPNIKDVRERATISALDSDARNIETAVDMYSLKNLETVPTKDTTRAIGDTPDSFVEIEVDGEMVKAEEINVKKLVETEFLRKESKHKKAHFYLVEGGHVVWKYEDLVGSLENKDTSKEENGAEQEVATPPIVSEPDKDGDGLSDAKEAELGTNVDVADTDGDGKTDGEEVALGTDPLVVNDFISPSLEPYAVSTQVLEEQLAAVYANFTVRDESGIVAIKGPKNDDYIEVGPMSSYYSSTGSMFKFTSEEIDSYKNKELTFGFKDSYGNVGEYVLYIDDKYFYYWEKGSEKAYVLSFNFFGNALDTTHLVLPSQVKGKTIYGFTGRGGNTSTTINEITIPASYEGVNSVILYTYNLGKINYDGDGLELLRANTMLFSSDLAIVIEGKNEEAVSDLAATLNTYNGKSNITYIVK